MGKQWKQCQILFWGGSKITADGDCSHEIKRHLLLGRKVMINLDSILKSRDITRSTKVHLVNSVLSVTHQVLLFETPRIVGVHHQCLEPTQTHVHWVGDAIQSSYPLLSPSPPAIHLSQYQGLFQLFTSGGQRIGVSASASVLPWIFRVNFL